MLCLAAENSCATVTHDEMRTPVRCATILLHLLTAILKLPNGTCDDITFLLALHDYQPKGGYHASQLTGNSR